MYIISEKNLKELILSNNKIEAYMITCKRVGSDYLFLKFYSFQIISKDFEINEILEEYKKELKNKLISIVSNSSKIIELLQL
jgi:hypothetical protein